MFMVRSGWETCILDGCVPRQTEKMPRGISRMVGKAEHRVQFFAAASVAVKVMRQDVPPDPGNSGKK